MDDELGIPIRAEVALHDGFLRFGLEQLAVGRVLLRVQDEPGVDHTPGQWEYVERSEDQMVPFFGDVQTAQLTVATGHVFICVGKGGIGWYYFGNVFDCYYHPFGKYE